MTHTKPRSTFKVDFAEKKDDPLDFAFRHCRIMESDGPRLVRTFTGKVPRSQSTVNGCERTLLAGVKSISAGCLKIAEPSYSTSITYGSPCEGPISPRKRRRAEVSAPAFA
jgi:hypothetical protein